MNSQTELAQVDAEIAELQAKLLKAQERQELLTSVKPACDAALEAIDKALDILCLVKLSNDFRLAEIAKFKSMIDDKFKFIEDERPIQAKVKALKVVKTNSKHTQSYAKANQIAYQNTVLGDISFPDRPVQRKQFKAIIQELGAIGIEIGKTIANKSTAKGWNLRWGNDKAGLYWTVGDGWDVEPLKSQSQLSGKFEGFDLEQFLIDNDIDLEKYVA